MLVSDILAKALEIWGPRGEHWCTGHLVKGEHGHQSYCLYGGIGMAAMGKPMYEMDSIEKISISGLAHHKALCYVRKAIGKRHEFSLACFNDSCAEFAPVKAVVCDALKQALVDEEQEETSIS